MMRKTTYTGLLAVLLTAAPGLTSCSFEDDDYFDESASLRIENFNKEVQQTLTGSEHGWVMQYYTGTQKYHFEGFNLFAKFSGSDKVLMAGNHRMLRDGNANKYTEDESIYTMLQEDGPVLAFSTWNNVLNVFADPVNPFKAPSVIENDGNGMNGDYNFTITSCGENEVRLTGERYQAHVRLVRCDRPWPEYIQAVEDNKNAITNTSINSYYITDGTDTLYLTGLRGGRMRYSERLTNPLKNDSMACCFTPDGFCMEKELKIGDIPFQEFKVNDDKTMLVSTGGQVQCIATWDSYIVGHTAVWKFDNTLFTPEMTAAYNAIGAILTGFNSKYSIESVGIGRSMGGNPVTGLIITYYTNASKKSTSTCGISLDMRRNGFGTMTYAMPDNPRKDANFTNILKKAPQLETVVGDFIAQITGTYSMTPDDYFNPTGATYTSTTGDRTFKLSK